MKHSRKLIVTVAAIVAIVAVVGPITSTTVAAQTNNSSTSTSTPSPTQTEDSSVEKTEQLGDLVVHDYRVDNGTMIIEMTWRGETPESVTLQEMLPMDKSGTARISLKSIRLLPDDRTTVEVDVSTTPEVNAVMVSTPSSIEDGRALLLREQGSGSDVEYRVWWVALLVGSFGTIFNFALVKKWRDWRASESIWRVPIDD